jgi:hypothetical protein
MSQKIVHPPIPISATLEPTSGGYDMRQFSSVTMPDGTIFSRSSGLLLGSGSVGTAILANGSVTGIKRTDRIYNVMDYGATGLGVADDTIAVQAAITASATDGFIGAVVYFPKGRYLISATLWVPSNTAITGAGMNRTVIVVAASFPATAGVFQCGAPGGPQYTKASHGSYITFQDFALDGSLPAVNFHGVMVDNVDFSLLDRVHFLGMTGYSVSMGGIYGAGYGDSVATYAISPVVRFCRFDNSGRTGVGDAIGGGGTLGEICAFNTFRACNGTAIDRVAFQDALWIGNDSRAPAVAGDGGFWSDFGAVNLRCIDNLTDGGSFHLFGQLTGVAGDTDGRPTTQKYCTFIGNTVLNGGQGAFLVSAANPDAGGGNLSHGHTFIGNKVFGCARNALAVSDCYNSIFESFYFDQWNSDNTANLGLDAAAISVQNGAATAILTRNNVFRNNTFGPASFGSTLLVESTGANGQRYEGNTQTQTGYTHQFATALPQSQVRFNKKWGYDNTYVTTPAVPASTVALVNQTLYDQMVYIVGGTASVCAIDGINIPIGALAGPHLLCSGSSITLTYTVAPTWVWSPVNNT